MSLIKKSHNKAPRTHVWELPNGEVVVVTQTTVKGTMFPEKLKKVNEMLKNTKLMDH